MSAPLPAAPPIPIEYPGSDGKPMGETLTHGRCIHDVLYFLHGFFAARADVLVAGDNFIYYEEGNPRASVVPDVFVVFGAVKNEYREEGWRDVYKLWEEPKGPDFVLEVTSPSTRREDLVQKRSLYGRLGVGEYFLFDPKGEYLKPRLQGMRLDGGEYERLGEVRLPGGGVEGLWSEVLGLYLYGRGRELRLYDPVGGEELRTHEEEIAARREEAAARQREAAARRAAEARAAEADARAAEADARVAEAEARVAELEALLSSGSGAIPPEKRRP